MMHSIRDNYCIIIVIYMVRLDNGSRIMGRVMGNPFIVQLTFDKLFDPYLGIHLPILFHVGSRWANYFIFWRGHLAGTSLETMRICYCHLGWRVQTVGAEK